MVSEPIAAPTQKTGDAAHVSLRTLLAIIGGGLAIGAFIVVAAIMPAEYNRDPTGLGKLTGVARLWAPEEMKFRAGAGAVQPAYLGSGPVRRAEFDIPLGAGDWPEAALEYKVAMKAGQKILFSWRVDDLKDPRQLEFDFHGHTLTPKGQPMTVAEYHKDRGLSDTGGLTAPFDGIHGWYFKNHGPDPVTVHLTVWGFFDLIPPGRPGNDFKVKPKSVDPA